MNVPKKLEKFNNFITNSFKIKDSAVSVCGFVLPRGLSFPNLAGQEAAVGVCAKEQGSMIRHCINFLC